MAPSPLPAPETAAAIVVRAEPAVLSTDYLNRYSEALMLIEMAPLDPGIAADLRSWRPVSYAEHFGASHLRCAGTALAAYRALDSGAAYIFDELCDAMNRLITTVTALLCTAPADPDSTQAVAVASASLRDLLARANDFILSNGRSAAALEPGGSAQDLVDALMAA